MSEEEWAPAAPTPLQQVAAVHSPGTATQVQVAGYSDLVEIGRGGDSIVYRAHQPSVGRDVAIKVISVADPATAARFQRELEITVRLGRQHPHIVNVLDTTTTSDGDPCLVMDFHDLGSLHERLVAHGPLPVSEVVAAGTAVADALTFAHRAGVLHRDVKPQNILLLPTSYVLSDFGIARMADAGHTATMERFSYRHASPQVLDGMEPTEADDVWSLGSTLFTLLEGRAPFAADDPADDTALAYLRRVRTGTRRPLRRTDLPAELAALVEGCLQPDVTRRVPSAAHALAALRALRTEDRSWDPSAAAPARSTAPSAPSGDAGPGHAAPAAAPASASSPPDPGAASGDTPAADDDAHISQHTAPAPVVTPPDEAAAAPSTPAGDAVSPDEAVPQGRIEASAAEAPAGDAAPQPRSTSVPGGGTPRVAPSALAHLGSAPGAAAPGPGAADASADADATGMLAEDEQPTTSGGEAGGREDASSSAGGPAHWRRTVAFLSGVLVAGVALGVGFHFVRQATAPEPPPPEERTAMEVPTDPGPVPTSDGPQQAPVGDPRFAPQSLVLVDRGTSAELSWAAPATEVDYYLVVLVTDEGQTVEVVQMVTAPTTEYTVQGLDPDDPFECFAVAGYGNEDGEIRTGSSDLECR